MNCLRLCTVEVKRFSFLLLSQEEHETASDTAPEPPTVNEQPEAPIPQPAGNLAMKGTYMLVGT